MIFLTVGTGPYPLDRLVAAADELARTGEEIVVQYGTSRVRPRSATAIDFVPVTALERLVRDARVVVCHAGVGSVATSLRHGKRPILVPRRRDFGEQVDDHQLMFATRIEQLGLARIVADIQRLPAAVAQMNTVILPQTGLSETLATELVDFIQHAVARRG